MAARPPASTHPANTPDLPPAVESPSPAESRRWEAGRPAVTPELLREVRRLAEKAGGFDRLREAVEEAERAGR